MQVMHAAVAVNRGPVKSVPEQPKTTTMQSIARTPASGASSQWPGCGGGRHSLECDIRHHSARWAIAGPPEVEPSAPINVHVRGWLQELAHVSTTMFR